MILSVETKRIVAILYTLVLVDETDAKKSAATAGNPNSLRHLIAQNCSCKQVSLSSVLHLSKNSTAGNDADAIDLLTSDGAFLLALLR